MLQNAYVVSYGRTIGTATAYTIMDKNNQAVSLVRVDKINDIGAYFDDKLQLKNICTKNKQGIYDVRLNQSKLQTYVYFYFCCIM